MFDAGIAAQTFCLAARDLGIGTCILGIFDADAAGRLLELEACAPPASSPWAIPSSGKRPRPQGDGGAAVLPINQSFNKER